MHCRKKILIIEDDPDHLQPMIQLLQHNKVYEILSAQNGIDGLAQAIEHRPDLIIIDLLLVERGDEMDGYDVIRQLRNTPETANVTILARTAHFVTETDQVRALRAGADGYIEKGVGFAVLEATIETLLRRVSRSQS